jgi:hypothetical protein
MPCRTFLFVTLFVFAVSTAQAAGLWAFNMPADAAGPAIRGLVWAPCAAPPQEIDARGGRTFFATQDCPIAGARLPLIVISHGRRGWLGGQRESLLPSVPTRRASTALTFTSIFTPRLLPSLRGTWAKPRRHSVI